MELVPRCPGRFVLPSKIAYCVDEADVSAAVRFANANVFHVRDTLVPVNGSGDTSWAWTQLWLYLTIAAIACVVWTILDRKRPNYERLSYWLRLVVRYYIASAALRPI